MKAPSPQTVVNLVIAGALAVLFAAAIIAAGLAVRQAQPPTVGDLAKAPASAGFCLPLLETDGGVACCDAVLCYQSAAVGANAERAGVVEVRDEAQSDGGRFFCQFARCRRWSAP